MVNHYSRIAWQNIIVKEIVKQEQKCILDQTQKKAVNR